MQQCISKLGHRFFMNKKAVRGLYSTHFGGGVDNTDLSAPDALLSQVLVLNPTQDHILLGKHKNGSYNDRWTGLIGELKTNESPLAMAERLIGSHSSLVIGRAIEKRAVLNFLEADGSTTEEHEFVAKATSDAPVEENESIVPRWFPVANIPYTDMPADDKIWYPHVLNRLLLRGTFVFNGLSLVKYSIHEVESL